MHRIGNPLYYAVLNYCNSWDTASHIGSYTFWINILGDTFFIVAGISQIFWALPMTKRWGNIWYYIGIAGMWY